MTLVTDHPTSFPLKHGSLLGLSGISFLTLFLILFLEKDHGFSLSVTRHILLRYDMGTRATGV